jgi:prophage regulatory protein
MSVASPHRYQTNIILRLPKVLQATALSRSSIYVMMAEGRFPKPLKLGERAVGWPEAEIAIAARDAA